MRSRTKYVLWDLGARLCATLPPLGATLYFFPLWVRESSGATFSGMTLVAIFVCMIPFWKKLVSGAKQLFETGMPVFWAILLGVLFLIRSILDQVLVIAIVGLGASLLSMLLCTLRNRYRTEDKEDET